MTNLEVYGTAVLDGKITACDKVRRQYDKLLTDLAKPCKGWHFDEAKATRPIRFIEKFCRQSQGKIGQPLKLALFQKAKFEALFGFVDDDGYRRYREALTIEGRKNGKTTEMAAVALYMLVADGEGAPEVYFAATKREQANKGVTEMRNMIQQSPALAGRLLTRIDGIHCPSNFGYARALASNTNGLDGLNGSCIVIDELAAIKNRDLYDLMKQSMSADVRKQPLLFCITTNGFVRKNIFDAQYDYASGVINGTIKDDRFLPLVYELDNREERWQESAWIKANPGLGSIKSKDTLREFVAKAKADPAFAPTVDVKDFNLMSTGSSSWLKYEQVVNRKKWTTKGDVYCIGGMDAADSVDLNAAHAIVMRPDDPHIYVRSMYWIPQSVLDADAERGNRRERDGVPYSLWVQRGYMRAVPGNKVNKRVFFDWFCELKNEGWYIRYIGYDPWHIDDSLLRDFAMEFGQQCMIPVRQGVQTLSQPMKDLAADMDAGYLMLGDTNPVTEMCLLNTQIKTDINGNIQPIKGERQNRIDGAVALICGYKVLKDTMLNVVGLNDRLEIDIDGQDA